MTYTFDVEYATHDTLRRVTPGQLDAADAGHRIDGRHRVTVDAAGYTDAVFLACAIVAATHADIGALPTAAIPCI